MLRKKRKQFETVIGRVFGGADGIDKSTESGDGSVDLEQGGGGGRLVFDSGAGAGVDDILEAHYYEFEF